MKYILIFLSLTFCASAQFGDAPAYQPYNLDFENSVVGAMPTQWSLSTKSQQEGFQSEATAENPYSGKYCMSLELHKDTAIGTGRAAAALHKFDAEPYRGKTIVLSAAVRAEITGDGHAGFYVAERTYNDQYPFVHTNEEDPVVSNQWKRYMVKHTVTQDAYSINIGLFLEGNGKAWIDDIEIDVVEVMDNPVVTKNLDEKLTKGLYLFSKAYGATKFFHASDEIENLETDTYLFNSISELEKSKDYKSTIENRISRIAPSAKMFESKAKADAYKVAKPSSAIDRVAVAKMTNNLFVPKGDLRFGTQRVNIYDSRLQREAAVYQIMSAKNVQGMKITYSTMAKLDGYGDDAHAELWFRVDFEDPAKKPLNLRHDEIITEDKWKKFSMDVDIPKDAKQIRIGLVVFGEGRAWFDEVEISQTKKGITMDYKPKNFTFNKKWSENKIQNWSFPKSSITAGYTFSVDNSKESYDGASLLISTDKDKYIPLPKEGEICSYQVSPDMWLAIPLTVYDDGYSTLPKSSSVNEEQITLHPNDYRTKIATVIEMWNYMRFYSIVDKSEDEWKQLFKDYVNKATNTSSVEEFEFVLNDMLKLTNNVRAEAWRTSDSKDYTLPFIVDLEGQEVEVLKSADSQIKQGDIIVSIDGVQIKDYLADMVRKYPGQNELWKKKKAYFELAAGDFKQTAKIGIDRQGSAEVVEIKRNLTAREMHIVRPLTLEWINDDIIYIDGTRLNDFEMMELMKQFENAKGMIIDLRGDALLSEHVLGFFVKENFPTYTWKLRTYTNPCDDPRTRDLDGYVIAKDAKLPQNVVFISGESSVGKSETILRLAKHYNIGTIVGEKTVGSYDVVNNIRLPEFYNFSMGIYPISFENDKNIKYKPIEPDLTISSKGDYPNDPKIKKAIEILEKKF